MATHIAVVLDSDWTMPRDVAAQRLRERWPAARITLADPAMDELSTRDVVAEVRTDAGEVEICADRTGIGVFVEGDRRPMADAIAWYRSVVPVGENVVLTDEGGSYVYPLGPGVTADDFEAFLDTGDPVHLAGHPA